MKSWVVRFAVISFALFLAGCAGDKFVRLADDSLVLGQTTQEQIRARLGTPYREGEITKNNQQLQTLSYAYSSSSAGGGADALGITPARSQGFIFFKDKLVGYEFASSYKDDSTNFDSEKVSQIKAGESTRSDVVRILGNPGGRYSYPLIANTNNEATNYMYMQTKGPAFNLKFYQKLLVVTFNAQGVVTDVEYTESGQK